MAATVERSEALLLSEYGLQPKGRIHRNPTTAMLYTHALAGEEGVLAEGGPLVVDTGGHTGRSPKDKFIVREPARRTASGGATSTSRSPRRTSSGCARRSSRTSNGSGALRRRRVRRRRSRAPDRRARDHDRAYHALFAKTMFIEPSDDELDTFEADALVLHAPGARGRAARRTARAAARSSCCTRRARRC